MSSTTKITLSSLPVSTKGQGKTTRAVPKPCGQPSFFARALKRLIPSNKPERGGTLRSHGVHDSESLGFPPLSTSKSVPSTSRSSGHSSASDKLVRWNTATDLVSQPTDYTSTTLPSTPWQQLYLERRERRRQRRCLKESGDYLGVQGINPTTGEMDIVTPSNSTASSPFVSLARAVHDKRLAYENARKALRSEKMRKWEMDKEALKAERRRRKMRWTRHTEGWSSAMEPDLSPITGSSGVSTPREAKASTETVVRAPREGFEKNTETMGGSVSTAHLATKVITSSITSGHGIQRKPVPIRSSTLSSQRSYSDLIPVESEFCLEPLSKPLQVGLKPAG